MRAGSSPKALADSLSTLEKRFKDKEIKSLIQKASTIQQVEKAKQLIERLKKSTQKTLVFVTHRQTLAYLATCLSEADIAFAEFRGDMSLKEKDESIESFRELVPVLYDFRNGRRRAQYSICQCDHEL